MFLQRIKKVSNKMKESKVTNTSWLTYSKGSLNSKGMNTFINLLIRENGHGRNCGYSFCDTLIINETATTSLSEAVEIIIEDESLYDLEGQEDDIDVLTTDEWDYAAMDFIQNKEIAHTMLFCNKAHRDLHITGLKRLRAELESEMEEE